MKENNLSQLVGALGGWLQARPYGAEQDALDRGARIVLDMRLLGVDIDDVDAPELAALDPEDRDVVDQARVWAQARREEARRRRAADERAARQRRVAQREAGPNEAFAWPARSAPPVPPVPSVPPVVAPQPAVEPAAIEPDAGPSAESVAAQALESTAVAESPVVADTEEPPVPAEPSPPAEHSLGAPATVLADPSDHEFFAGPAAGSSAKSSVDASAGTRRSRALKPDAVFKVVLVIWTIAALGVLAVLLRIAFG